MMVCRVLSIVTILCGVTWLAPNRYFYVCVCVCECMSCRCSLSWYHWKCIGFPVARWSHFASNGRTRKKQRPKKNKNMTEGLLCYAMKYMKMEMSSQTVLWLREWYLRYNCSVVFVAHSQHIYRFLRHFMRSVQCVRYSNELKYMKICASTWDIYSLYHFPVSHKYIYIYHHVIQAAKISIKYLSKWEQKGKASEIFFNGDRIVEIKTESNSKCLIENFCSFYFCLGFIKVKAIDIKKWKFGFSFSLICDCGSISAKLHRANYKCDNLL